jgi:hypothetical protein
LASLPGFKQRTANDKTSNILKRYKALDRDWSRINKRMDGNISVETGERLLNESTAILERMRTLRQAALPRTRAAIERIERR